MSNTNFTPTGTAALMCQHCGAKGTVTAKTKKAKQAFGVSGVYIHHTSW